MGCYIWYSEEGPGRAGAPPSPLLAVPNVAAHPSAASVPITVLLYNGPLLCGFNVPIKGLKELLLENVLAQETTTNCCTVLFAVCTVSTVGHPYGNSVARRFVFSSVGLCVCLFVY